MGAFRPETSNPATSNSTACVRNLPTSARTLPARLRDGWTAQRAQAAAATVDGAAALGGPELRDARLDVRTDPMTV
jgi:hypothetical protein